MAWSDWMPFNQEGINQVKQVAGVYELVMDKELLYFGQSNDLNTRLMEHLDGDDSCIHRATHFRVMASNNPEETKTNFLNDYRNAHDGNSPPCND